MTFELAELLDRVDWVPCANAAQIEEAERLGIPYATHTGVLTIGAAPVRVWQLNTGMRIVEREDVDALLAALLSTGTVH